MDFEKENSSENEQQDNVYSSEPENSDPVTDNVSERQDGFSFEQQSSVNNGEYRIPNPKQDRDFASEQQTTNTGSYYNPYNAGNSSSNYNGAYNYANNQQHSENYGGANVPPKKPSSKNGKKVLAVLLCVFLLLGSMGIGVSIGRNGNYSINNPETTITTGDSAQLEIGSTETATSSNVVSPGTIVASKARSSIVGVMAYDSSGSLYGEGSGVVMGTNDKGTLTYIITCAHVISDDGIASCGILLEDGTVYDAKIVGYDERTDIGVLSIKETNLKAASFGDSDALKVGESVYAIGNPGGSSFYGSVTDGIVSALDRSITSTYTMKVIQHTAAISPGNSGGALVNAAGQVIGINSSKISATDYEGIGFAVPMKTVKTIVEDIIAYGYVPNRPKLGISYASVSDYQAYSMVVQIKGLPAGSIIVASISDDSSLKDTDIEVGDMITAVNGKEMTSSDVLLDLVDSSKVGDVLELKVCRIDAKTYKISTFTVKAKVIEDKPSEDKPEETTSQSYYDYYGNNDSFGGYGNFEDFFNKFFGEGY